MGPNLTQAEGFILGVGAKMFIIAGPVIVPAYCRDTRPRVSGGNMRLLPPQERCPYEKRLDQIGQALNNFRKKL